MQYLLLIIFIFDLNMNIASAQIPGQPPNSYVSGSNWYCNSGYVKSENSCVSIFDKSNSSIQIHNSTSNTHSTEQNSYQQDMPKDVKKADTPAKKKLVQPKNPPNNPITGGLPPLKN